MHSIKFAALCASGIFIAFYLIYTCPSAKASFMYSNNQSGLSFESDTISINVSRYDSVAQIALNINNHEDTALTINNITSSCNCLYYNSLTPLRVTGHTNSKINVNMRLNKEMPENYATFAIRSNYANPLKVVVIKTKAG